MSLVKGKKGLIMGVANERSIAWGIAKKLSENGAELAFTYLGDALKKRVTPLAESVNSKFLINSLKENVISKKTDSYIKHFFTADILDQTNNEIFEKKVFIKILPLLNVSQSLMDDYNLENKGKNNAILRHLKSIPCKPMSINLNNDKLHKKEF